MLDESTKPANSQTLPGTTAAAPAPARSLEGLHSSVNVPSHEAGFWKQYRAFVGPALLVSVGYMDPGNWGTDLAAGAQFKYGLLWVVGLSSLMAIVLQVCSSRLGVVMGKDLAQACRDHYPAWTRWPNWLLCELAIAACDLAEVLGSAVALNLLFHIPLLWAVIITALDVLLLLGLQRMGMRMIEAVILVLIATIAVCYCVEIFVLPQTQPEFGEMWSALRSPRLNGDMIYFAIGIIGATVMPHNLYLHSALVQSRKFQSDDRSIRKAIQFNTIDSMVALSIAMLVNAAILVLAATVFFGRQQLTIAGGEVIQLSGDDIPWFRNAYLTLAAVAGNGGRQFSVCHLPLSQRPEQHDHRHARRPSRYGRVHALADAALAAAADHADAGCGAGDHHHRLARGTGR